MTTRQTHNHRTGTHHNITSTVHALYDGPSFVGYFLTLEDGPLVRVGDQQTFTHHQRGTCKVYQAGEVARTETYEQTVLIKYYWDQFGHPWPDESQVRSGNYYGLHCDGEQATELLRAWLTEANDNA